jgi:UPF0755 protein
MTDYGRGSGSEPWHPEDPLFGDVYDQAYQSRGYPQGHQGQGYQGQPGQPYEGRPYPEPPQHPGRQPPHPQQQGGWQDPYTSGAHQQYPQPQQQGGQPQQQYPQTPPQQPYQPQSYQQPGYDGYDTGSYQTGGYGHQDPYGGHQPPDPYGGQHDFYGENGYPPPQQPQYRQQPQPGTAQPGMQPGGPQQGPPGPEAPGTGHPQEPAAQPLRTAPERTGEWDTDDESDPRDHAFFSGDDGDDDRDDVAAADGRRTGKSQPKGGRKRRSGCACLVVLVVLGGGLGGTGYFGYHYYKSHFGPAPDFTGQGTGNVQVDVPPGSSLNTIGNILKKAGVVKSVDAFTTAANKNPKGRTIQAGIYVLQKQMSAAAAVTLMLDPKSQSAMIVSEGMRDKEIYATVDQRLGLPAGTTQRTATKEWKTFGLPAWANSVPHIKDPLEGFLFPSRYSVAKGMAPEAVLKQMVREAKQQYAKFDLVSEAKKQGLKTPLQLLTVASLAQAEGKTDDDFRKMAKVVYNRMVPGNPETAGLLQFDSTYNYIKNIHATDISLDRIKAYDDPYNTYKYKGLPPGPIGNPGIAALQAAMNPDPGNWYYFLSLDGKTTKFTETKAEFDKLYRQYNGQ